MGEAGAQGGFGGTGFITGSVTRDANGVSCDADPNTDCMGDVVVEFFSDDPDRMSMAVPLGTDVSVAEDLSGAAGVTYGQTIRSGPIFVRAYLDDNGQTTSIGPDTGDPVSVVAEVIIVETQETTLDLVLETRLP